MSRDYYLLDRVFLFLLSVPTYSPALCTVPLSILRARGGRVRIRPPRRWCMCQVSTAYEDRDARASATIGSDCLLACCGCLCLPGWPLARQRRRRRVQSNRPARVRVRVLQLQSAAAATGCAIFFVVSTRWQRQCTFTCNQCSLAAVRVRPLRLQSLLSSKRTLPGLFSRPLLLISYACPRLRRVHAWPLVLIAGRHSHSMRDAESRIAFMSLPFVGCLLRPAAKPRALFSGGLCMLMLFRWTHAAVCLHSRRFV